jgi:hypothetical protein
MVRVSVGILLLAAMAPGADPSASLLAAAAAGSTNTVKALLEKGANLEATDKNERTPLMLAAQHGHADTVRLLVEKGAKADARDKFGWTAYGLAMLAPAGHGDHTEAAKALGEQPRIKLAVNSDWAPDRLQSSCFAERGSLPDEVGKIHLNALVLEEFAAYSGLSGKGLVDIVRGQYDPADALVRFTVQPGAACSGGVDNLTLSIDVRVYRLRDKQLLLAKSFGGGFKGLRTQSVNNIGQYAPVYLAWIKPQASPMYWAVVEAIYRVKL